MQMHSVEQYITIGTKMDWNAMLSYIFEMEIMGL